MWQRKDDAVDEEGERYKDTRKTKCAIAICVTVVLILVLLALLGFFLYPRVPYVAEDGSTTKNFVLTSSELEMNVTVYVLINNTNYVDIDLESLELDIYHQTTGDLIGTIDQGSATWPQRTVTIWPVPVNIYTTDPQTLVSLNQQYQSDGYVTCEFIGPIKIKYIGYEISKTLDFVENIS